LATTLLEQLIGRLRDDDAGAREAKRLALESTAGLRWVPNPGPQTEAFFCEADELYYGGEAGGGKSDLLIGLGLTAHSEALILRRLTDDAKKLSKRAREVAGHGHRFNGQDKVLQLADHSLRFAGCQFEDDKERFKGTPYDLYAFDEIPDFTFTQFKFITGWNRSTRPGQRCRIVCAGNPPTRPEGLWVVQYWGAWLDPNHPNPARDGELRWYIRGAADEDIEVDGPGPHAVDWEREPVLAKSRTFIRSSLADNPDLAATDYRKMLDSLPAELRRAYRDGDFGAGIQDDDWQVIPTAWIEAAQQRWDEQVPRRTQMTAMAVDVAPGGGDQRVICWRYGGWYGPFAAKREADKTGRLTAAEVVKHRRDRCPVIVDLGGGWGGDALIALKDNGIDCVSFNGVSVSHARTRDGKLKFVNKRAESIWKFREELDPSQEGGSVIALPPDPELKADLSSYRWEVTAQGIKIEDKDEQKKRLGRSPDKGDAAVMCLSEGNRAVERMVRQGRTTRALTANNGGRPLATVGRR
jgi:hypothetical protein